MMKTEQQETRNWSAAALESVTRCPICDSAGGELEIGGLTDTVFSAPGTWQYLRCPSCRSAYLSPRPTKDSIYLAYENYCTHIASEQPIPTSPLRWLKRAVANGYRNRWFNTHLRPSSSFGSALGVLLPHAAQQLRAEARGLELIDRGNRRVLDVGCGSGGFLALAKQMGWNCFGVEVDAVAADVARRQGVTVLSKEVGQLDGQYADFFDAVTLSHVIEHVFNPVATLRECLRVVRPGGYIWIETPNIDSIGYERYRHFWRGLDTPRHLVLFNHASLRVCIQAAGFVDIRVLPPRDVMLWMFLQSTAIEHGLAAKLDDTPIPVSAMKGVKRQVRGAKKKLQLQPNMSEFITMVAYRP
jgi:2-polyprenyl-3-methyl-5-hydroxy-6-metoxy-1,4-benzoquinol methylase